MMSDRSAVIENTHDTVWELLPWCVNGTLEPDEMRLVEQHAETCAACRHELAAQRRLGASIADAGDFDISESRHWEILRKRISQEGSNVSSLWETSSSEAGSDTRFGLVLDAVRRFWMVPAIAAAASLSLVVIPKFLEPDTSAEFRTLTAPASVSGPVLRIKVAEGIAPADLGALLKGLDMEIVEGPSPTGVYSARSIGALPLEEAAVMLGRKDGIEFVTVRPEP